MFNRLVLARAVACIWAMTAFTQTAHAQVSERLAAIIEAYGGAEALTEVETMEAEWVGYFIGRYQSRYTEPPYDRLPVRNWTAIDFESEHAVVDSISTWPGELNMGSRTIIGDESWTLNTISRIYTDGVWHGYRSNLNSTAARMPFVLVRNMMGNPQAFSVTGTHLHRGITYDVVDYNGLTFWVHPETSLIYAYLSRGGNMTDGEVEIMRTYTHYFEYDGVMVNRRYQIWTDVDETSDMELYSIDFHPPMDSYMQVPEGFEYVEIMDGYNGVLEIEVEEVGRGAYLAGNGETRILYVELEDSFVAMEAGGMPDYAAETYAAMEPYMNGKPLRYIIPTHHHDDHAVAVHFYARAGASVLTTRDKEGFLRRLLARTWGEHGPVEDAEFTFLDETVLDLSDEVGEFTVLVYQDAPHTENMLVGYLPEARLLYTCDIFIGWVGEENSQGAPYSARHLAVWVAARQAAGEIGEVDTYASCHGRAYSAEDFAAMLEQERQVVTMPGNEAWPTATWFERFGLSDDTVGNPRRAGAIETPALD